MAKNTTSTSAADKAQAKQLKSILKSIGVNVSNSQISAAQKSGGSSSKTTTTSSPVVKQDASYLLADAKGGSYVAPSTKSLADMTVAEAAAAGKTDEYNKLVLGVAGTGSSTQSTNTSNMTNEQFVDYLAKSDIIKNDQATIDKAKQIATSVTKPVVNPVINDKLTSIDTRFNNMVTTNTATPWTAKGAKDENHQAILSSFASDYGKLFSSQEDLMSNYNSNPTVKASLDKFIAAGGTLDQIAGKVQAQASDITVGDQTLPEYLASIGQTTPATPEQIQAFTQTAADRIAVDKEAIRLAGVRDDLLQYYYGDDGFYTQQKAIAQEKIKIAEMKERNDQATLRERTQAANDKLKTERDLQKAIIEENRVQAKNYMTGMLAKLGALTTTSATPIAISELDAKYNKQVTDLDSKYNLAVNENELSLNESIREVEENAASTILAINENLSASKEEVQKTIFNAKLDADKQISKLASDYASDFTKQTAKYTEDIQKASATYLKTYGTLVGFDALSYLQGKVQGTGKTVSNKPLTVAQKKTVLQDFLSTGVGPDGVTYGNPRGSDGYVDPQVYITAFENWDGTVKDFLVYFPVKSNVNPASYKLLPEAIRPATTNREI